MIGNGCLSNRSRLFRILPPRCHISIPGRSFAFTRLQTSCISCPSPGLLVPCISTGVHIMLFPVSICCTLASPHAILLVDHSTTCPAFHAARFVDLGCPVKDHKYKFEQVRPPVVWPLPSSSQDESSECPFAAELVSWLV